MANDLSLTIARVALQDRRAFSALYERTAAKLFGICLRLLRDRGEAEDVLQEAYIKIWRNAAQFAAGDHSPMAWLIAIARNTAIDRLRARQVAPAPIDDEAVADVADTTPGPEHLAMATQDRQRIDNCLKQLEPARADALAAAYLDGFSYQEIADRHKIPLNTVRTWLRRGLSALRDCLSR